MSKKSRRIKQETPAQTHHASEPVHAGEHHVHHKHHLAAEHHEPDAHVHHHAHHESEARHPEKHEHHTHHHPEHKTEHHQHHPHHHTEEHHVHHHQAHHAAPAHHHYTHHSGSVEANIIENLVQLQKVHLNLAERFDNLSKQIAALLGLFEMAAKNFTLQPGINIAEKDKSFMDKIERILEQNRVLAKGLTLLEEKMRIPTQSDSEIRPAVYETGEETTTEATFTKRLHEEYEPSINRPLQKF